MKDVKIANPRKDSELLGACVLGLVVFTRWELVCGIESCLVNNEITAEVLTSFNG